MAVIRVGFTGTKEGMTTPQVMAVNDLLRGLTFEARHGGCWGADDEFHTIVTALPGCQRVVVYPSHHRPGVEIVGRLRPQDVLLPDAQPLVRNKSIVRDSEVLVACPKTAIETLRSGTWATVREAKRGGVPFVVVTPTGGKLFSPGAQVVLNEERS